MHMVFDAADFVKRFPAKWMPVRRRKRDKTKTLENALFRPDDTADIGIEPLRNLSRNPGCASLRRGDDMKKKLRIRARHRNSFAPPGLHLNGLLLYGFAALHPQLQSMAPPGYRMHTSESRDSQRGIIVRVKGK